MANVLVVEDNPQNRKLTTLILESEGHTVRSAADAAEAERLLAARRPDLIVLDMALPGKDGYTLAREVRSRPEWARLPILALSAFAMPGDAERALAAGCTGYLTKPVRRTVLLDHVAGLLRRPTAPGSAEAPSPPPSTGGAP